MAYYKTKKYKRHNYKKYKHRKRSSFYNIFSKYHSCKWKRKYNQLQRSLYLEANYF